MNFLYIGFKYIPSHREDAKSFNEIVQTIMEKENLSKDESRTILKTVLPLLHLLNIIRDGNDIKISGQIQHYLRNSILWYVKNKQTLLSNWERRGTAKELIISNLLNNASYFLKILEQRKVNLCEKNDNLVLMETRTQPVSLLLIKCMINNEVHLLHQWDAKSEAYQMIGGKIRLDETPIEAAERELLEEIHNTNLINNGNFVISRYKEDTFDKYEISNTYGALTKYKINIFHVKFKDIKLNLSKLDKWLSLTEILQEKTNTNEKIINTGKLLEDTEKDFFADLPVSIILSSSRPLEKYLEIKPSFFGIKFDLKKYFQEKKLNNQTKV